jgi:protein-S-isoprenylcysteine O-methyltransferase Ste14
MTSDPAPPAAAPAPSLLIRVGNFFFRYRNAVFPLVWVPVFVAFKPHYPRGSERLDHWLDGLGFTIGLAGQVLRALVIGYKYVKRGGKKKQVYADKLVTEGFFNHSRNPLYLGNLLVLLGLMIIHNNPWVYAILVPFFLFTYTAIVAAEEAYLRRKFGAEYDAYCARVNRWLPDFRGLSASLRGMRFAWSRLVIKEYGTIGVFLGGAILLMAYETLRNSSADARGTYDIHRTYFCVLAGLFVVVVAAWIVARSLKKRGVLIDAEA